MATGFALCRSILYNGKYEKQKDDKPTASKENQRRQIPYVGIPSSKMERLEEKADAAEKVTNSLDIHIMRWYNQHMKTNEKENMSYKFENTPSGQLVAQLQRDMMELIEVPNHMLPEAYRNHRDGGRSLAELESMMQEVKAEPKLSDHEIEKIEKARRIEQYAQQWEENETIEYDVDEYRLDRFENAFVKGAVAAGWIEN